MSNSTGLKQRILTASSSEEIAKLLDEGKAYEFASVQTRNSWKNAANRARGGEKYIPSTSEKVSSKKKARRS